MWTFDRGASVQVSPHFNVREFSCKHCGLCHLDPALVCGLELLRFYLSNLPITVTSGYRCPQHPVEIGGTGGQHTRGTAADVHAAVPLKNLLYAATNVWLFDQGGIGFYPDLNIVHVDVRQGRARWGQIGGSYVSLEDAVQYYSELQNRPTEFGQAVKTA